MQGRGRIHKAMFQWALGGSVADITKAVLVAVQTACDAAPVSSGGDNSSASGGGSGEGISGQLPHVVLVWGANLVVLVPAEASVYSVAAGVRSALAHLAVGGRQLAVPGCLSAGRSLHFLSQQQLD